ncbi:MAG: hypothetical protein GC156_14890 [Actinomycetales bacterium]|nr:hypothetical protein [Actinomycetales bacterium]
MSTVRKASAVILAGMVIGLVGGAALGVVWAALAPRVPIVIAPDTSYPQGYQPEGYLGADLAFGALALIAGVLVTIGLAYMRREHLFSVLVGGLLAAGIGTAAMWFVGTRIGSVDIQGLIATTVEELVVDAPLQLTLPGMYLMWPLGASAVVTVLALSDWIAARHRG